MLKTLNQNISNILAHRYVWQIFSQQINISDANPLGS